MLELSLLDKADSVPKQSYAHSSKCIGFNGLRIKCNFVWDSTARLVERIGCCYVIETEKGSEES